MNDNSGKNIDQGISIPDNIEALYFNGFTMGVSAADVVIALQVNGKPSVVLNTSFTTAKTLGEGLINAISELEKRTETTIMTTHSVDAAMNKDKS